MVGRTVPVKSKTSAIKVTTQKSTLIVVFILLIVCLTACNGASQQNESNSGNGDPCPTTIQMDDSPTVSPSQAFPADEETHADTALNTETESEHSQLYIDGLDVEEVVRYFSEVCLDAEIVNSGDASVLQKWKNPIYYVLNGSPTNEDVEVLNNFTAWLNTVEGFPGIYEAKDSQNANLHIHFCTQQDMFLLMGEEFTNVDGAVTYWYEENEIYNAIVCCRTDLNQTLRNSVILEEIYNGLGPIQDTNLRSDSIIYSEYSEPQCLSNIDELILKLLYHPQLQCGMNADECEDVIRQLYY